MSKDNPFGPYIDDDETILRPNPGGFRSQPPPPPGPPNIPAYLVSLPGGNHNDAYRGIVFDDNPLISSAIPLFALIAPLRSMVSHSSIPELHQQIIAQIRRFEAQAVQGGASQEHVRIASYALCSLLDEAVLATPWGAHSFWVHQSLLVNFHGDTWGGEKVFEFLDKMILQPGTNLHLIEFFWLALNLGFKGKYGVINHGLNMLEEKRIELYQLIQRVRGDYERELSAHWQGFQPAHIAITQYLPGWVIGVGAALLLVLVYLGFAFLLNRDSDLIARDLYALSRASIQPLPMASPMPPSAPRVAERAERFRRILAEDISANRVEVVDDRIIRIRDSFASGSDKMKPIFLPMVSKIAQEIAAGKDTVLITGHTDDVPIFNAKFPSNFDLSTARANHVAAFLRKTAISEVKVRCEGRADFEPLAPNDTAENRSLNRRVDILIQ